MCIIKVIPQCGAAIMDKMSLLVACPHAYNKDFGFGVFEDNPPVTQGVLCFFYFYMTVTIVMVKHVGKPHRRACSYSMELYKKHRAKMLAVYFPCGEGSALDGGQSSTTWEPVRLLINHKPSRADTKPPKAITKFSGAPPPALRNSRRQLFHQAACRDVAPLPLEIDETQSRHT